MKHKFHKVRVSLSNEQSNQNLIYVDGMKIVNVREFSINAVASRTVVTITFFADVEGGISGAQAAAEG